MSFDPVRVALIQMSCVASVAENLDRAAEMVRQAARDGAQIVCLPEALPRAILLPARRPPPLHPRRVDPRPFDCLSFRNRTRI